MTEKWQYSYVEKWADGSGAYERVTFDSLAEAKKYHRDSVGYVAYLNAKASNPDDQIVATVEKRRIIDPGRWEPVDAGQGDGHEDMREALARAVFIASDDFAFAGRMAKAWDAPGPHGRARWYNYADAILDRFHVTPKEEQ